jgi:ribosomal protein S18 acetylase RimI-like enzyme
MEDKATHFLLRLTPSLTPIGTIRVYKMPGPDSNYKLTRLAVLKDYRKYNFGRALVLALHEWVGRHALQNETVGPVKIICHSQLPVKGFYAK